MARGRAYFPRRRFLPVLAALVLLLAAALGGCAQEKASDTAALSQDRPAEEAHQDQAAEGQAQGTEASQADRDAERQGGSASGTQTPEIGAKPKPTKQRVTLYFGDREAMYLLPEEREVVVGGDETLEAAIIRELMAGPRNPNAVRVIPEGTRLLSVSVVNGVAYVNFSNEFQLKHWGGTAGERMTIYATVNSLCKLPGITRVQFLLEGQKQEAILGHLDTTRPLAPNWDLVKD